MTESYVPPNRRAASPLSGRNARTDLEIVRRGGNEAATACTVEAGKAARWGMIHQREPPLAKFDLRLGGIIEDAAARRCRREGGVDKPGRAQRHGKSVGRAPK